jgi:hypothetical protein
MQQLETTIASLTNRGEQLAAKRVTAHDALDKAIKYRQQTLLSGDLDDQRTLDKLQGAVDTAASTLAGIDDVLAVLAQQKAEAEHQLAAERQRIERAAAADKLDKQVVSIEAALPGYLEQSRALADALSKIGDWHFESGQMAGFLQNTMGQIEIAANFALAELKALPEAIRQGRQAIPRELALKPVAVPEPPPTMTIFMLRSANYRDHDGRKRFAGQWEDATMPVPTAAALSSAAHAVPTSIQKRQMSSILTRSMSPRTCRTPNLIRCCAQPTSPRSTVARKRARSRSRCRGHENSITARLAA